MYDADCHAVSLRPPIAIRSLRAAKFSAQHKTYENTSGITKLGARQLDAGMTTVRQELCPARLVGPFDIYDIPKRLRQGRSWCKFVALPHQVPATLKYRARDT